jgi:multicomponent Na+:H+ antiporter subunit F
MIALAAAAGVAITLALALVRLFAGPTLHDRTLAASAAIVRAALIAAAIAVSAGQAAWIDAAIALALGAFVVNTAVLKFFRARTFQAPLARAEERL